MKQAYSHGTLTQGLIENDILGVVPGCTAIANGKGGHMNGEELCRRGKDTLRKIYIKNDNVVGFRLAGDVSAAGLFRTLMNKKVNVADFKHRLLQPGFGIGVLEGLAVLPLTAR